MIVIIRRLEDRDVPELEEIFLAARRKAFSWINPETFQKKDFKEMTEGEVVFVAEGEQGDILGFLSVWEYEDPPFIHNLFVSPSYQRRGVGRLLIEELLSWLPPPYRLKCLSQNKAALAFYFKNHWVEICQDTCGEGAYFLLELPEDYRYS